MTKPSLTDGLKALARTLPRGSGFDFGEPEDGVLWLHALYVPPGERGVGTAFLAAVVALADAHGTELRLHADPTDEPGDPYTCDLARWYARFGFEMTGISEDDWVVMARTPRPASGVEGVLAGYAEAKATRDMSQAAFEEARERLAASGSGPGRGFR